MKYLSHFYECEIYQMNFTHTYITYPVIVMSLGIYKVEIKFQTASHFKINRCSMGVTISQHIIVFHTPLLCCFRGRQVAERVDSV